MASVVVVAEAVVVAFGGADDVQNACYQLLKLLGCDLAAIDVIKTWKQFGVLCIEFVFACLMLFLLWKMLYNAMVRFFNPRR